MNAINFSNTIFNALTNQALITRVILAIMVGTYLLFALILNRQIGLLSTMVSQITFSPVLKFISLLHVIAVTILLLYIAFLL